MVLEVDIDRDVGMGSGNNAYETEGVFALDDDSVAQVVDTGASPDGTMVAAVRKCPTRAITVRRDGMTLT